MKSLCVLLVAILLVQVTGADPQPSLANVLNILTNAINGTVNAAESAATGAGQFFSGILHTGLEAIENGVRNGFEFINNATRSSVAFATGFNNRLAEAANRLEQAIEFAANGASAAVQQQEGSAAERVRVLRQRVRSAISDVSSRFNGTLQRMRQDAERSGADNNKWVEEVRRKYPGDVPASDEQKMLLNQTLKDFISNSDSQLMKCREESQAGLRDSFQRTTQFLSGPLSSIESASRRAGSCVTSNLFNRFRMMSCIRDLVFGGPVVAQIDEFVTSAVEEMQKFEDAYRKCVNETLEGVENSRRTALATIENLFRGNNGKATL